MEATAETPEFNVDFLTKKALYEAYMPFVKNGGLFIKTEQKLNLGHSVQLKIKLPDEPEIYSLSGQVIWINPQYAQGNLPKGIGVQFNEQNNHNLKQKIENCIAGISQNEPTDTM